MAIYQRRDSRFLWIKIYRGTGVPPLHVSSGTTVRAEARQIEAQLKAAHRGNVKKKRIHAAIDDLFGDDTAASSIPLAGAWTAFLSAHESALAATTEKTRGHQFGKFVRYCEKYWPHVRTMAHVTPPLAFAYRDAVRPTQCGRTWNQTVGLLRSVWRVLLPRAGLETNVWELLPRASTTDSHVGRAFTVDEEERILATCQTGVSPGDWYGACIIAKYTGLRLGDILALTWADVHGDWLRVMPSKTMRHNIKTTIYLHPAVRDFLAQKPRNAPHLFPVLRARAIKRNRYKAFSYILERAQIDPRGAVLSFHCWRHTFVTTLAAAGVSRELRMQIAGHTLESTHDGYNHDTSRIRAAIERLA